MKFTPTDSVRFTLILAKDLDGTIGDGDRLPWHMPAELQHFKRMTVGKVTILGRKTYESLPAKALEGRTYIVLTYDSLFEPRRPRDIVLQDMETALEIAADVTSHTMLGCEVMIAGGANVFNQAVKFADRAIVTTIDGRFGGDAHIEPTKFADWTLDSVQEIQCDKSGLFAHIDYFSRPADRRLTPCVGTCSCSQGDSTCRGCGRSDNEVRDWNRYPRALKRLKMGV